MTSTVQKLGEGGMAARYYSSYRGLSSPEVSSSYAATKKKVIDDDDDDDVDVEEKQGDERNEDEENEREGEEELELGLSLGARKIGKGNVASVGSGPWKEYCRILTAKDFPSMVASRVSPNSSSASSSFSLVGRDGEAHPSADDGSHAPSQVVGWPPIRSYRMNNLFNQNKDNASENNFSDQGKKPISQKVHAHRKSSRKSSNNTQEIAIAKDKEKKSRSHFVKVNMDGMAIGRKVDLSAHRSYETLALVLEDMFKTPFKNIKASMLLDGSSEFVLTYEDKDGDWMLVGDVPWGMFLSSVRRLRIMRTSDANGLAPGFPPATA